MAKKKTISITIKLKIMVCQAQLPLLCMVDSNRLHVSTLHAGHLKAFSFNSRLRLKCDGTHAETRFHPSPKRASPFKSAGASVLSTPGSLGVRISVNNAGYTMF